MKITNLKATVAKVFTVGLLAGAVAMAAPQKAEAQVAFGVRIGRPVYRPAYRPYGYVAPAPVYGYGGFYGPRRFYYDRWHHGYWR